MKSETFNAWHARVNAPWRGSLHGAILGCILGLALLCAAWPVRAQQSIKSFLGVQGKRLGESVNLPFNGASFTASDGTVWLSASQKPFPYTAAYAGLLTDARTLVTSAVPMNGPYSGNWLTFQTPGIVGPAGGTWLMVPGNVTNNPTYYFTSTNAGSTWTKRTLPVASKQWYALWDGTNYVLYATGSTTTGVQESTDAINWTSHTAISVITGGDLLFNGTTYLVIPAGNLAAATSTDRVTWTSRTMTSTPSFGNSTFGTGNLTWNAGAGLWVTGTSSNYQYQTSPDGITWTARATQIDDTVSSAFRTMNNVLWASSPTVTISVGNSGAVLYSTDCLTWTLTALSSTLDLTGGGAAPSAVFWDGTRFVVYINELIFYSTDGATWVLNPTGTPSSSISRTPTGALFGGNSLNKNAGAKYHLTDMTSTATNYITAPSYVGDATNATGATYLRIK